MKSFRKHRSEVSGVGGPGGGRSGSGGTDDRGSGRVRDETKVPPQKKTGFMKGKVHSVLKFGLVRMAGHIPGIYNFLGGCDCDHNMALNFAKFAA